MQQIPSPLNKKLELSSDPKDESEGLSCWKRIRQILEVELCRFGFWICPKLPYRFLVFTARFLGLCGYFLAASERRVALANLEAVFGGSHSRQEKQGIARRSFQSFARTAAESFAGSRLLKDGLKERFEFSPGSLDLLSRLVSQKRGLIALTFHYGNWEWLSLAWGMAGYPTTVVAQPIKNQKVEELFRLNREQTGHQILHRRHAARQLYKVLKRNQIIGLLVDLNSSAEEGGDFFSFLGLPALTTRSVGLLAIRTGAPIVCSIAYPQEDGRYRVEIGPEIPYNANAPPELEMDAITNRWLAHCENVIRQRPEYWMWMYKRWKARPTEEAGFYPFYSFYDRNMMQKLRPKTPAG